MSDNALLRAAGLWRRVTTRRIGFGCNRALLHFAPDTTRKRSGGCYTEGGKACIGCSGEGVIVRPKHGRAAPRI